MTQQNPLANTARSRAFDTSELIPTVCQISGVWSRRPPPDFCRQSSGMIHGSPSELLEALLDSCTYEVVPPEAPSQGVVPQFSDLSDCAKLNRILKLSLVRDSSRVGTIGLRPNAGPGGFMVRWHGGFTAADGAAVRI